jgi:hypothetical protein
VKYREHLIDDAWWKAYDATISETMKHQFVIRRWSKIKTQFHPELIRFIDKKLSKDVLQKQVP